MMSISGISSVNSAAQSADLVNPTNYQQDLQSLGKALQSGDLAGAQQSFAQLLQDKQGSAQGDGQSGCTKAQGHHHHHHHKASASSQGNQTQSDPTAQSTTTTGSTQIAQSLLSMPASGILPVDPSATGSSGIFL